MDLLNIAEYEKNKEIKNKIHIKHQQSNNSEFKTGVLTLKAFADNAKR